MEINRVILKNVGPFETLEIPIAPTKRNPSNITVFIGNNGGGKTSVLQALATSLGWFIARLRTETGKGTFIPEDTILNRANTAAIDIELYDSLVPLPHPMDNLRVRRKPRLHMSIDKDGETLNVAQLSHGEKSLMALIGDIARRLAMMNPALENPLEGDGIVLIDEVDLHLHPSWQRGLCDRLIKTFPHCQFVLTTHSPLVISDCKDVLAYSLSGGELQAVPSQYGQDANTVLLEAMDTSIRKEEINVELNDLLDAIQDSNFNKAQQLLEHLNHELPINHLELVKATLLLQKQKLRYANHQ